MFDPYYYINVHVHVSVNVNEIKHTPKKSIEMTTYKDHSKFFKERGKDKLELDRIPHFFKPEKR